MNLDRFSSALADRLSSIAPPGVSVTAADGMLWYSASEGQFPGQAGNYQPGSAGSYVRDSFGVFGTSIEENAIGIGVKVLDELQDYISEATHEPWPGRTKQPKPNARIVDSQLSLWYGDQDTVVLACDPISLADLE